MTEPKKLIVNLFEMNCVSHISHGLWVLPGNNRHRFNEIDYWTELAQLLEHGGFDGIFLADVVGAYDTFRGGPETAIRGGVQIPNNDPLMLIPAMAAVTKHLGFGVTFSTSYEPPFAFARRMSTLDHLTRGRVGWNIVTSYLPNAARNFGLDDEIPHNTRYEIADEYLDVVYKLWEGSWDDDAVLNDRENRVYADPDKVRYIHHSGEHFRVAGPHLSQPSLQRTPVLYQATGSPAGIEFAGRHAEVVFTGGRTSEDFRRNAAQMREAAVRQGRREDDIRFIVQAGIVTGRTDAEVSAKLDAYRENSSLDGILAHGSVPFDLTVFPGSTLIADAAASLGAGSHPFFAALRPEATVADVLAQFSGGREGRFFVAGTPDVVADEIEKWLDEAGVDGINLRQYHSLDTARDFAELIAPELRKRGRLREGYPEGETLRERLFGAGQARLPERHPGARYRGGANLDVPVEPLRFASAR